MLSWLSSLPVFIWAEFFHSCCPLVSLTIPFTHAFCQSSLFSLLCLSLEVILPPVFLISDHQSLHYACRSSYIPPPLSSSLFSGDLYLKTDAVLEPSHQAHLCFQVPDTIMTRWCWAAGGHNQLLPKHCGVVITKRHNKICNGQKMLLAGLSAAASFPGSVFHPAQVTDGT